MEAQHQHLALRVGEVDGAHRATRRLGRFGWVEGPGEEAGIDAHQGGRTVLGLTRTVLLR